ncbi:MAG: hypothetical protein V3R81_10960 [Gammaproteobacteria bacterium]
MTINEMSKVRCKRQLGLRLGLAVFAGVTLLFGSSLIVHSQSRQQVKVLLKSKHFGNQSEQVVQGSGSVIIRRRNVRPSGRLSATERHTTVQRSTGIFTLVRDGGESILTVATRIPYEQVIFYRDYATGLGYVTRSIAFDEVGTSLKVTATILPGNQVQIRLTPRISFLSPDRSGAIDFTEASTEVIVPSGQPVSIGGSTSEMHEVTRRILGFSDRSSESESSLVLTATIQ